MGRLFGPARSMPGAIVEPIAEAVVDRLVATPGRSTSSATSPYRSRWP